MKKSTKGLAIFLGCVVGTLLIIAIGITSVYVWLVEEPKITSEEFASHNWLERSSDSYLVPESNGDFKYYKSKDDLDDYYYTGTYEFYCGEDAVNYVVDELSDYKYGLTRDDIDDYIRYGGTMSISGKRYHSASTFASAQTAGEYVDSAIPHNIQHSLCNYQYGDHFRALWELYDSGELTTAIQRIVEDINHAFTLDVLTRQFHSHDLRVSANNLRRDRSAPSDIPDQVNTEEITHKLRELLCILEKDESSVKLTEAHRTQIRECLRLLGLVVDMPVVQMDNFNLKSERTMITQPGMRYAQTQELIGQLLADDAFRSYSLHERTAAAQRIMQEVMGRMMEDIVLLETQTARPHAKVFPLQFAVGEFDMVVFEPEYQFCEIYEIKHSTEIAPPQARHLRDEEKCKATAFRFGEIRRKGVIYRGQAATVDQIEYINVEEYLLSLGKQR